MKSCGKRFHDEVGKFRFLNELIKVVSPKVSAPSPSPEPRRQTGAVECASPLGLLLGLPQPLLPQPPLGFRPGANTDPVSWAASLGRARAG